MTTASFIANTAGAPARTLRTPRQVWEHLVDYTRRRMRFASFFVRRSLGLASPRTLNPALLPHGLTLVLPGIESESIFTYGMCDGLMDGGTRGAIRVFNWGLPLPGGYLANLTRIDRNRRRAADLAAEIVKYQDAFPGRPVHLVAQSGGCGIALFAAEQLPEGHQLDGIVILGPSVSPTYNLTKALKKCRKGILSSYSCKDFVVLGLGTRFFGTTDRKFCWSAGSTGFQCPPELSAEEKTLYAEKLHQLPWTPDMAETCEHFGGHLSWGSERFLEKKIAPWVKA